MISIRKHWMVGLAVASGVLSASALTVNVTRYAAYEGGAGGGEFTVFNHGQPWEAKYSPKALANYLVPGASGFQTFCLEVSERFANRADVVLSDKAIEGGVGPAGDPLSVGAAWLYAQFATGSLPGYDYTGVGRKASALALQKAIWYLEDEITAPAEGAGYVTLASLFFGSEANAKADNNWQYNVAVMNMYDPFPSGLKQDMLVYLSDGGLTLVLLGCGLLGLAAIRRKE